MKLWHLKVQTNKNYQKILFANTVYFSLKYKRIDCLIILSIFRITFFLLVKYDQSGMLMIGNKLKGITFNDTIKLLVVS